MRGEGPTIADREEISRGIAEGLSGPTIARRLGKNRSVVYREIHRCGGCGKYRAADAQQRTEEQSRRPKPRKLAVFRRLHDAVADGLAQKWSPQQISARMTADPGPPCAGRRPRRRADRPPGMHRRRSAPPALLRIPDRADGGDRVNCGQPGGGTGAVDVGEHLVHGRGVRLAAEDVEQVGIQRLTPCFRTGGQRGPHTRREGPDGEVGRGILASIHDAILTSQ